MTEDTPVGKCFNHLGVEVRAAPRLGVNVRCGFLGVKVGIKVRVSVMNSGVTTIRSGWMRWKPP